VSANAWNWRRRNVRAEARARRWERTVDWDEFDRFITTTLAALPVMTEAPEGFHFEPPYGELVPNEWPHEFDNDWYPWGKTPEESAAARAQLRQAWETIVKGQSS
jgi:hypothetical protein